MGDIVIRAENIGKKYLISHQQVSGNDTLKDHLTDGFKSIGRQLLNLGKSQLSRSEREEFWALKDVSFEIKQGERVGIIGRNGAGKSTLLKILSQITEPTTGEIAIRGRVASLLEVGTGFHPDLTGRENVFLNGAILGMGRREIKRKFDEIVAFAEVEKFLDTPVKRYSSGMYVRLAFAVAAHLEPEILIVDEVLAVGDAQFQKKCLGKMQTVSANEGRTVLFVSHNIDAIQRLCSRCIMLERGRLTRYADTPTVIQAYISGGIDHVSPREWIDLSGAIRVGTGEARFLAVQYSSSNESILYRPYPKGSVEFILMIQSDSARSLGSLSVSLFSLNGNILVNADTVMTGQLIDLKAGNNMIKLEIESLYLKSGIYTVALWLDKTGSSDPFDFIESAFEVEVVDLRDENLGMETIGPVTCEFKVSSINSLESLERRFICQK